MKNVKSYPEKIRFVKLCFVLNIYLLGLISFINVPLARYFYDSLIMEINSTVSVIAIILQCLTIGIAIIDKKKNTSFFRISDYSYINSGSLFDSYHLINLVCWLFILKASKLYMTPQLIIALSSSVLILSIPRWLSRTE